MTVTRRFHYSKLARCLQIRSISSTESNARKRRGKAPRSSTWKHTSICNYLLFKVIFFFNLRKGWQRKELQVYEVKKSISKTSVLPVSDERVTPSLLITAFIELLFSGSNLFCTSPHTYFVYELKTSIYSMRLHFYIATAKELGEYLSIGMAIL